MWIARERLEKILQEILSTEYEFVGLEDLKTQIDDYKKQVTKTEDEKKMFEMKVTLQAEYHQKTVAAIEKAQNELKEFYVGVIKRLPEVRLRLADNKAAH